MIRLARWAAIGLVGLAGLAAIALLGVWAASEAVIGRTYAAPTSHFHAAQGSEAVARGEHLTQTSGCIDCHRLDLSGAPFTDVPGVTLWSRNLRLAAKTFSDADFDRSIRHGVTSDGRSVLVMPSDCYAAFTDAELGAIVAYLRSLSAGGAEHPGPSLGLAGRLAVLRGELKPDVAYFATDKPPLDLGPATAFGRHLAQISCAECHGTDLAGSSDPAFATPNLSLVAAYDRADFARFLRTGKAAGGRELGLMSAEARRRFRHFTDAEVDALYDYLSARGRRLAAGGS